MKTHLKMIGALSVLAMGLFARADEQEAVTSTIKINLDTVAISSGVATRSVASLAELMPLTYEAGATVAVTAPVANAGTLVSDAATGGEYAWTPQGPATWTLTHTVGSTVQTATFTVPESAMCTVTWLDDDGTMLATTYVAPGETPTREQGGKTTAAQYCTFTGWSPTPSAVTAGSVTYTAQYSYETRYYDITWKNVNGDEIKTESVAYGETPTCAQPSYDDAQYTYTFSGWSPEVAAVAGEATYTATYSTELKHYTITWLGEDGEVAGTESLGYGSTPSRAIPEKTPTTHYVFNGSWQPAIETVVSNTTYALVYETETRYYTITWLDDEGNSLGTTSTPYGETPTFTGTADKQTAEFDCSFAGWTPQVASVRGDASYTATYEYTRRSYDISWYNEDGTTLIDTTSVPYGYVPTHTVPTKESTAQYDYEFAGWSPVVAAVTGSASYTATFTPVVRSYEITWQMDDGTLIDTTSVEYGTLPTHGDVVKADTETASYTFIGWTPEIVETTGEAVYTATFESVTVGRAKLNLDTVTVSGGVASVRTLSSDLSELLPFVYEEGATVAITAPSAYAQTLVSSAGEAGEYTAWAPQVPGTWTFTHTSEGGTIQSASFAVPTDRYCAIVWKDDDGTTLGTDYLLPGETPSRAALGQKTTVAAYCAFSGWSPLIEPAVSNTTYTATYLYTPRPYAITWKNRDGTTVATDTIAYGTVPVSSVTPEYDDAQYTYTFTGWTPEPVAVTGPASYTATYSTELKSYTITWLSDDGETVIDTTSVAYGSTPMHEDAEKVSQIEGVSYEFIGWKPAVVPVTGNATYRARFKENAAPFSVVAKLDLDTVPVSSGTAQMRQISSWSQLLDITREAGASVTVTDPEGETSDVFASSPEANAVNWEGNAPGLWSLVHTLAGQADARASLTFSEELFATVYWRDEDGTVADITYVKAGEVPSRAAFDKDDGYYSYNFTGWSPAPEAAVANTVYSYTANYEKTEKKYTITWLGEDGETVLGTDEFTYNVYPEPTSISTPTKASTAAQTFEARWLPERENIVSNAAYTLSFEAQPRYYEITFENQDGTELFKTEVAYGQTPEYEGETPEKEPTTAIAYVFAGWMPELEAVSGDATYTATYTETARPYPVYWYDDTGVLLDTTSVAYGQMPSHEAIQKASGAQYDYEFAGWMPEYTAVSGEASYTAIYVPSVRSYTVTWRDDAGNTLATETLFYGQTPARAMPGKESTAQYDYESTGWSPAVGTVTGDATYTATYAPHVRSYTVTWAWDDGTTMDTDTLEYGEMPEHEDVVKESETIDYTFTGWSPEVVSVAGDAVYTACFDAEIKPFDTVVKFNLDTVPVANNTANVRLVEDWSQDVLPITYRSGATVAAISPAGATERIVTAAMEDGEIAWAGDVAGTWQLSHTLDGVVQSASFLSSASVATANWYEEDGTFLATTYVAAGAVPTYYDLEKDDAQYTYTFKGWVPEPAAAVADQTYCYTADWKRVVKSYDVTFRDWDGTELATITAEYGSVPEYPNETPERAAPEGFAYEFTGWQPAIASVTGEAEYTATYKSVFDPQDDDTKGYFVVTWLNYDGSTLDMTKVSLGDAPVYEGEEPTRAADENFTYVFGGWTPSTNGVAVIEDMSFTAEFVPYSVAAGYVTYTWYNADGSLIATTTIESGAQAPADPEAELAATAEYTYVFDRWQSEEDESGNVTKTAVYTATKRSYEVAWVGLDGEFIYSSPVEYGQMPEYNEAQYGVPTAASDGVYSYEFTGWAPAIVAVTGAAYYEAQFTKSLLDTPENQGYHVVTWVDGNGAEIYSERVASGTLAAYDAAHGVPTKASAEATVSYEFAGWLPALGEITEDTVFVAQFNAVSLKGGQYAVVWRNYDGTLLAEELVEKNTVPQYTGAAPARAATEAVSYTFTGWTPTVAAVSGDAVYTATFDSTPVEYQIIFANWNGVVLQSSNVAYGVVPTYDSGAYGTPTKPADGDVTYTFAGWSPTVTAVTGTATYVATYTTTTQGGLVPVADADELAAAVAAASEPVAVILVGDIPSADIDDSKEVTITPNGHTIGALTGPATIDLGNNTKVVVPAGEVVSVNADGTVTIPNGSDVTVVTSEVDAGSGTTTTVETEVSGPATVDTTPEQGEDVIEVDEQNGGAITKETTTTETDGGKTVVTSEGGTTTTETYEGTGENEKLVKVEIDEDGDGTPETTIEAPEGGEIEKGTGEDEGTYTLPDGGKVTETTTETDPTTGETTTTTKETEVNGPATVDPSADEGNPTILPDTANGGSITKETTTTETDDQKIVETKEDGTTTTETFDKGTDPETGAATETLTEVEVKDDATGDTTTITAGEGGSITDNGDGTYTLDGDGTVTETTTEIDPTTGETTTTTKETEVTGPATVDPSADEGNPTILPDTANGGAVTKETTTTESDDQKTVTTTTPGGSTTTETYDKGSDPETGEETETLVKVEIDEDGDGTPETTIEAPEGGEIEKGTGDDEGTYTLPDGGKVTETTTETDPTTGETTTTTKETEVTGPATVDPSADEGNPTIQPDTEQGGSITKETETEYDGEGNKVKETETTYDDEGKVDTVKETDGDGNSETKDGEGNIIDVTAGGEGEGSETVDISVDEGGSITPIIDGETGETTGYKVTGPATVTLPDGTTIEVPADTTVEVDKTTGEVTLDDGESVKVTGKDEDGNDVTVTVTGPATVSKDTTLTTETDNGDGTTTTDTTEPNGDITKEKKDSEGNITEVETGGNDGTGTENGEPKDGVKIVAGEGGTIEKNDETGDYTVTGPATITLPTEPETTIEVPQGERVTVAKDGTVTKVEDNGEGGTTTETIDKDGNKTIENTDGEGNITDIEVGGTEGGEGEDMPGVKVELDDGGDGTIEKETTGDYTVTGPATITLPTDPETVITVPENTTVTVNDDGTIEIPEGAEVTAKQGDGEPTAVTGPVTLDSTFSTSTTDTNPNTGDTTTEKKDTEGNITEVETGGNDGTGTGDGEPEAGVKIVAGEGGTIIKDNETGEYTVTGPATITLPTDPETVIEVPQGETVKVAKDGTITKVEENADGSTTTETTDKDGNKTLENTDSTGKITSIEVGGSEGGEGDDEPGVKVELPEGSTGSIEDKGDGTWEVTGEATITLPTEPETVINVPAGETVTVDKDGTITKVEDNGEGGTTTETTDKDGNKTTEEKDGEGNITSIEAGATEGGEGEDKSGVRVELPEGSTGSIVDKGDGTWEVTGEATITLPTEPETVINVPAGETVTVDKDGTITKVEENADGSTTTETTDKDGNKTTETKDGEGNTTSIEVGGTEGGEGEDKPGVRVELPEGSTGSIEDKGDGTWKVTGEATITLPTEPEQVINVPAGKTVTVDSEGNVIEVKTEDGTKTETITKPDGTTEQIVTPPESDYDEETTEGTDGTFVRKTDKQTGAVVDEVFTPKNGEAVHSGEGGFAEWLDDTAVADGKAVSVTAIELEHEATGDGFTITFKPKLDTEEHKQKFTTWFDAMECANRIKVRVASEVGEVESAEPQVVGKVSMKATADGVAESVTFTVDAETLKSIVGEDAKQAFFQVVVE